MRRSRLRRAWAAAGRAAGRGRTPASSVTARGADEAGRPASWRRSAPRPRCEIRWWTRGSPGTGRRRRWRRRCRSSPDLRRRPHRDGRRRRWQSRWCRSSETSAIPSAPTMRSARSSNGTVGTVNGGKPSGQLADHVDAEPGEIEDDHCHDGDHNGDQHAWDPRQQAAEQEDGQQGAGAHEQRRRHRLALRHASDETLLSPRSVRLRRPRSRTASAAGR